jgi:dienelactone hydrolase
MELRRREFLRTTMGTLLATLTGCAAHDRASLLCPAGLTDFQLEQDLGPLAVYRLKRSAGPAILLLHEMPGMSLSNLALAHCLGREGFSVYLPLLFGEPGQARFLGGYFQSCAGDRFDCSSPNGGSTILNLLRETRARVIERSGAPIGIIGMCLTGAFPLALLGDGVFAAVACQPTLPFNALLMRPVGAQRRSLGLSEADLDRARQSSIPLLAMRYRNDSLCPRERFGVLRRLTPGRLAVLEIDDPPDGHSALAWELHEDALADTVNYLKVCLEVEKRARLMRLAKFNGRRCEITPQRRWRSL